MSPAVGTAPDEVGAPVTVLVAGDLAGADRYHAGDEAMSEAVIANLTGVPGTGGGVRVIATSADPAWTRRHLGCDAVEWVGFAGCDTEEARADLLRHTTADLADRSAQQPPLVRAALDADAIVIAGGGNLNSHWPEHLYERVLLGRVARHAGLPLAITGQTIGPTLAPEHVPLATELLTSAGLVGLREPHSLALVLDLGIDPGVVLAQVDDAIGLPGERPAVLAPGFDPGDALRPRRFIAVTVHPFAPLEDPRIDSLAAQLLEVADRVGAALLFVPHMRGPEGPGGISDEDIAQRLAGATGGQVLAGGTARQVAWAARSAWAVVSSRYHPLVFATSGGVPALALPCDPYTEVKCVGALDHVGLGSWHLSLEAAAAGMLAPALGELARRHEEVARWATLHGGYLTWLDAVRLQRLQASLGLPGERDGGGEEPARPPRQGAPTPVGAWALPCG